MSITLCAVFLSMKDESDNGPVGLVHHLIPVVGETSFIGETKKPVIGVEILRPCGQDHNRV